MIYHSSQKRQILPKQNAKYFPRTDSEKHIKNIYYHFLKKSKYLRYQISLYFQSPLAGLLVWREKFPHPQTIRSSLTGNSNNFRFVIFNILFSKRPWRTQGWGGIIFQTQRILCNAGTSKKFSIAERHQRYSVIILFLFHKSN